MLDLDLEWGRKRLNESAGGERGTKNCFGWDGEAVFDLVNLAFLGNK